MAYKLAYSFGVNWVVAGPGSLNGPAFSQVISFKPSNLSPGGQGGGQVSPTFTSADITRMVAAMAADVTAQLNAALPRIQGFASGTD